MSRPARRLRALKAVLRAGALAAVLVGAGVRVVAPAATVVLINQDAPGVGLNDRTPVTPVGGNPAATLGAARLAAMRFAASLWAQSLQSEVPIKIEVQFASLGGSNVETSLGQGGPAAVYRDFAGAPLAGTWYPSALANKLAGLDLSGGTSADIGLTFNSDVDQGKVLGGSTFYYGFDNHPATGQVSFLAVASHELGHGLGITSFVDETTGAKFFGYDDVLLRNLVVPGAVPPDLPSMTDGQRLAAFTSGSLEWPTPTTPPVASPT